MIEDYVLFARTIATGSISAAARDLRISPAMISRRLAQLEERLGARLINRTTRHLLLTDVGEVFYAKVVDILARTKEAESIVATRAIKPSGRLRISASIVVGRHAVSPHLASFIEKYPDVRVELELEDEFVDLRRREFDLAIRLTSTIEPHLEGQLLVHTPRILCCARTYAEKHGVPRTLAELKQHSLLGATSQFPWKLEGPEGAVSVHAESVVRTNSSDVVRDLLLGGLGIARRSPRDVADEIANGEVVRVLPQYHGASNVGIYAVYIRDPFAPAVIKAFIDHLLPVFENGTLPIDSSFRGKSMSSKAA